MTYDLVSVLTVSLSCQVKYKKLQGDLRSVTGARDVEKFIFYFKVMWKICFFI